jgi:hypothetical protein
MFGENHALVRQIFFTTIAITEASISHIKSYSCSLRVHKQRTVRIGAFTRRTSAGGIAEPKSVRRCPSRWLRPRSSCAL